LHVSGLVEWEEVYVEEKSVEKFESYNSTSSSLLTNEIVYNAKLIIKVGLVKLLKIVEEEH